MDIKLIRPFIIYIIKALNSIFGIYNLKLKEDEIQFLKDIKNEFCYDNQSKDENQINKCDNEENDLENDDGYFNLN